MRENPQNANCRSGHLGLQPGFSNREHQAAKQLKITIHLYIVARIVTLFPLRRLTIHHAKRVPRSLHLRCAHRTRSACARRTLQAYKINYIHGLKIQGIIYLLEKWWYTTNLGDVLLS